MELSAGAVFALTFGMLRPASSIHRILATLPILGAALPLVAFGYGCGGKAIVDADGGAGGTDATTTTSGPVTSVQSVVSVGVTTTASTSTSSSSSSTSQSSSSTGGAPPFDPLTQQTTAFLQPGETITVETTPNTLGITAVAETGGNFEEVAISDIVSPANSFVLQNNFISGTSYDNRWFGTSTAGVPFSDHPDAMPLLPGTWQFTLSPSSPPATLSLWTRQTIDGQFHGGAIDINVFRAAGAPHENYIRSVMAQAFDNYAGVTLGNVTVQPLAPQFAVIDESNALEVFLETGIVQDRPAVNVMWVEFIDFGASGYSPGAPGLPLKHGTLQSGIVLQTESADFDITTMRHEVGHFAGLHHTSEIDVPLQDSLSDTPFCPDVLADPFACPDSNHTMFPFGSVTPNGIFSPQQQRVIQGSPFYRGAVEPGGGFAPPFVSTPMGGPSPLPPQNAVATPHLSHVVDEVIAQHASAGVVGWQSAYDADLVAWLSLHQCGRIVLRSGDVLDAHEATLFFGREEMVLALAEDVGAPLSVRVRAVRAAARAGLESSQQRRIAALADDTNTPQRLRLSSLAALDEARAPLALATMERLAHDDDTTVALLAQRRLDRR